MKIPIGVDADDCLIPTIEHLLLYYNHIKNTKITIEHCTSYNLESLLGISQQEWRKFESDFYSTTFNSSMELHSGVRAFINLMREQFEFHIITARSIQHQSHFMYTLGQHFHAKDFAKVHMIGGHGNPWETKKEKWQVCKEEGIAILIDDNCHHVNRAGENGIKAYLIEKPWNRHIEVHGTVTRVKDFNDLYTQF